MIILKQSRTPLPAGLSKPYVNRSGVNPLHQMASKAMRVINSLNDKMYK